jgi:hypothetical protein
MPLINDPDELTKKVEQYPLCNKRIKRLQRVCGGTLLRPYCNALRKFVVLDCVHCQESKGS